MDPKQHDNAPSVGRRRALQIGAATAVGAATWAKPSLKGFARTPAYAAEGSGIAAFDLFLVDPFEPPFPHPAFDGRTFILPMSSLSGTTLTVEVTAVDGSGVALTGCVCVLTSADFFCGPVPFAGTISGATVEFDLSSCGPDPSGLMIISGTCS